MDKTDSINELSDTIKLSSVTRNEITTLNKDKPVSNNYGLEKNSNNEIDIGSKKSLFSKLVFGNKPKPSNFENTKPQIDNISFSTSEDYMKNIPEYTLDEENSNSSNLNLEDDIQVQINAKNDKKEINLGEKVVDPNSDSSVIMKSSNVTNKSKNSGSNTKLKELLNSFSLNKIFVAKNTKIVAILVVLAIVVALIFNTTSSNLLTRSNKSTETYNSLEFTSSYKYINNLEQKLTNVLSNIKGAGKVTVMVTLENGPELKIATSVDERTTTTSSQSTSNTSVTVVENPILISQNGKSTPLVLMEIMPKIKGVIVVSEGAGDVSVKLKLLEAIQALLEVPNDNIQIFSGI